MAGRIILVGAGEMMASMSGQHRATLARLPQPPHPVFLDTTAGYETNIDAIAEKAVEYYQHHLQTELRVARYRHRDRTTPAETAAAIAEIRAANLIFAGPGSPTYAIRHWRDSAVWDAVLQQFEAGADLFFASAASITLGRYALPVYEVYKAGHDPYWTEGLDVLGRIGLNLAIVPHYNDNSGGENYDSRFCYMGARRFDQLQEQLPPEVAIVGIDAYTCICFDPATETASVSGQGTITIIGDGAESKHTAGDVLPFAAFASANRRVVKTASEERSYGYEFSDTDEEATDAFAPLTDLIEGQASLSTADKIEMLAALQTLRTSTEATAPSSDAGLVDLVLELREALRMQKRFDLADKARNTLEELGFEIGDTPQGATWTRR
jgi:cyanophycinase-like exopeptidase